MEHRKRYGMQHKVELSTLLRIVITNHKGWKFKNRNNSSQHLTKVLAAEAMKYLQNCDRAMTSILRESSNT